MSTKEDRARGRTSQQWIVFLFPFSCLLFSVSLDLPNSSGVSYSGSRDHFLLTDDSMSLVKSLQGGEKVHFLEYRWSLQQGIR
ncbi:hypothetical protein P389DRAFT_174870 [Cystobasidium minutum MCA 4210]|uniref:uncharacterized protein n=1 Tax=Cystobasidium minutum MCA 4210 TaxID=1397322 RepID=UPI0034CD3A90|eukprot:jgi/Rhomi1/174870/fgenesh1_kg.8_\